MMIQAPKGTKDIYGNEAANVRWLEDMFADVATRFGFAEIKLPTFEHTELFQRGVGDATDIVQKEMYTFLDKGDRSITLRPEGTAGTVRAYLEHGMASEPSPLKFFYCLNNFRYERPQKGRYREFTQFGVELFGSESPMAEVEVLSLLVTYFAALGLDEYQLHLNSIGCADCRPAYHAELKAFLEAHHDELCEDCQSRYATNPLRTLDCKNESCQAVLQDAPKPAEHLCEACDAHYADVKRGLDQLGIAYEEDPKLVRGLDYYTRTVFEFLSDGIGAQSAICGGGRYDDLVETLGGPPTPAIGFAFGLERLRLELEARGIPMQGTEQPDLYILAFDDTRGAALKLAQDLRGVGLAVETDIMERSFKAQMKHANRINARKLLVLGTDELEAETVQVKDMASGEDVDVPKDELDEYLFASYLDSCTEED